MSGAATEGEAASAGRPAARPAFGEAVRVWTIIGLLSFGGPAGQIALMHRMLVDERKWISEKRFLHALNFCMLLPGPEAQQLATYVGWLLHGTRGGIVAGTLFVLPGLAVILTLSTLYALYQETTWLGGLFFGLKAAVLAIVIEAVIRIGRRALKGRFAVAVAATAFVAIFVFRLPFPLIIVAAGLAGLLAYRRGRQAAGPGGTAADPEEPVAAGGEGGGLRRAMAVILVWGAVWAAPVLVAGLVLGFDSILPRLGAFFSLMAVVTFGGAYAVLAYVADAAVATFGWLSPGEMLDGLALAETTPGPLILVLSFVGYLAAFREAGGLDPLVFGLAGGLLVAWVTFIPSFLWIFLGAPWMERLRGSGALSAALSAITAAVVGVILNLAVWLGLHVLFRDVTTLSLGPARPAWPVFATVDWLALGLFAVALAALFRLKLGMVPTLAACGVLGLAGRLLS